MTRARDVADTQDNIGGAVPPVVTGKNAIYNSGFDIAQRGTSFTGLDAAAYTLDRWIWWSTTGGQSNYASQQSVGNLSVTPNQAIRYCGRFGRTSGTTNTGGRQLFQTLETSDSVRFAGKTVTFSFYARAGANYSNTSNILQFAVVSGTGTDQIYYSFTGSTGVISSTSITLTTSWQRFTATGTVPTNATQLATTFIYAPTGTAGAADYFEITGVQLEEGSVATPYTRAGGTIQGELAACQRYYFRVSGAIAPNAGLCMLGFNGGTVPGTRRTTIPLPVTMRTVPSVAISGSGVRVLTMGLTNLAAPPTIGTNTSSPSAISLDLNLTSAGAGSDAGILLIDSSSANDYVEASAEL
jgi:hypothetical protein